MDTKSLILRYIDEFDINIIHLDDLVDNLKTNREKVKLAVMSLVNKGILSRLQREIYARPSFSDQYVIAYHLCKDGCISYWSALSYHGLTTQFSNTIYIQTTRRIHSKNIYGTQYKFIKTYESKIGQLQKVGRGNNMYFITSIEKTICDCFDRMEYSGGWTELLKGFYKAKLDANRMIEACTLINNVSTTKRIGYLAELTQKKGMKKFINYAKNQVNDSYSVLDTESIANNNYNTIWMLILNVSDDDIISNLQNMY